MCRGASGLTVGHREAAADGPPVSPLKLKRIAHGSMDEIGDGILTGDFQAITPTVPIITVDGSPPFGCF